jgi:hypothetical protein
VLVSVEGPKELIVVNVPPTGCTEKFVVPPQLIVIAMQMLTFIVYVPFPLSIGAPANPLMKV